MKRSLPCLVAALSLAGVVPAGAVAISLGSAAEFAVLANSTITNTTPTTITGDVGLYPGTSVTGFGLVTLNGTLHVDDSVAQQAQADALTAYNALAALPSTENLTGTNLGGLDLTAGVYTFSSSAQLTGTLTLTGPGPFVFQIGSTLTTASGSAVDATDCGGCDVYWQVGSSATLGTTTAFEGTIIAKVSDTLNTGATIVDGRAFALTGAVTLQDNTIAVSVPEPSTWALMLIGFGGLGLAGARRTKLRAAFRAV
jgi:hypothetical protein